MLSEKITIGATKDLGATPTAMLVQIASKYDSSIYIHRGESRYNAKSIMGMMSLGLWPNDEIEIVADGTDETAAVEDIKAYLVK